MSALPPFHQFRHGQLLDDGAQRAEGAFEDSWAWVDPAASQDEQENWHYTRTGSGYTDSSGTQVYPRVLRMALIATLSLLCWAMVVALWHGVAHLLH